MGASAARTKEGLSVGAKLTFTTVLVLSVVTIALFIELTERERTRLVNAKAEAATMVTDLFAESLVPLLDFDDVKGIDADLQMLRANKQVLRAAVWNQESVEPRAVLGVIDGSPLPRNSAVPVIGRESLVVVRPIVTPDQRTVGSTAVEFSLHEENAAYREARRRLLWISALIVSGTALALIGVARRLIGRPLRELADAARRFEAGDYSDPPTVQTSDEIGTLAEAFRAMARATTDREVQLNAATDRVRELFDALRQGVVVIGRDGLIEPGFSRGAPSIFGTEQLVGKPLAAVLYPPTSEPNSTRNAERQAFAQWVDMAFAATPEEWPMIVEEAPREAMLDGPSKVDLVLEFRALFNEERQLERLIIVATDETAQRALERAGLAYKEALENANKRMRAELEASRAEIAAKNRLEKEMEIATQIQTALVPPKRSLVGLEVAARMLTATEVGGDYYDIVPVEEGAWIGVGDVSGHGLTAGVVMLMIQSALAALFKDQRLTAPRELVVRLNDVLFENIRTRLHQDDHATLTVFRYYVDGRLTFAGAHEPIVIVRTGGEVDVIDPPGTWVGGMADVAEFTVDSTLQLRKGDLIIFHTDGVTEARNKHGVIFGLERLVEVAQSVAGEPVERVCDAVFAALAAWNTVREDDQTLLVARYNGPPN